MKAVLEFDLNDPDDRQAHQRCVKALDMALALWEIRYNLKKRCESMAENYCENKHKEDYDIFTGIDIVTDRLNEIFEENNLDVEELIN